MFEARIPAGELAASARDGDTLACVGLGSCVGLALFDRVAGVGGLAHVMLPHAPRTGRSRPGRYGDLAPGALASMLVGRGASAQRLEAVIAGGSDVIGRGPDEDIGRRNVQAVAGAVGALGIPLLARETGGVRGRTLRLFVSERMTVSVRPTGGEERIVHCARAES